MYILYCFSFADGKTVFLHCLCTHFMDYKIHYSYSMIWRSVQLNFFKMWHSGKTHTMLGMTSDPGIIPRVIQSLFEAIEEKQASALNGNSNQAPQFKVTFSYMEIYNEKVRHHFFPLFYSQPNILFYFWNLSLSYL